MNESSNQGAAVVLMMQLAFREWRAAEDEAIAIGRQLLSAGSRSDVEQLCGRLIDVERGCVGSFSRFASATHAYADLLKWASDADVRDWRNSSNPAFGDPNTSTDAAPLVKH